MGRSGRKTAVSGDSTTYDIDEVLDVYNSFRRLQVGEAGQLRVPPRYAGYLFEQSADGDIQFRPPRHIERDLAAPLLAIAEYPGSEQSAELFAMHYGVGQAICKPGEHDSVTPTKSRSQRQVIAVRLLPLLEERRLPTNGAQEATSQYFERLGTVVSALWRPEGRLVFAIAFRSAWCRFRPTTHGRQLALGLADLAETHAVWLKALPTPHARLADRSQRMRARRCALFAIGLSWPDIGAAHPHDQRSSPALDLTPIVGSSSERFAAIANSPQEHLGEAVELVFDLLESDDSLLWVASPLLELALNKKARQGEPSDVGKAAATLAAAKRVAGDRDSGAWASRALALCQRRDPMSLNLLVDSCVNFAISVEESESHCERSAQDGVDVLRLGHAAVEQAHPALPPEEREAFVQMLLRAGVVVFDRRAQTKLIASPPDRAIAVGNLEKAFEWLAHGTNPVREVSSSALRLGGGSDDHSIALGLQRALASLCLLAHELRGDLSDSGHRVLSALANQVWDQIVGRPPTGAAFLEQAVDLLSVDDLLLESLAPDQEVQFRLAQARCALAVDDSKNFTQHWTRLQMLVRGKSAFAGSRDLLPLTLSASEQWGPEWPNPNYQRAAAIVASSRCGGMKAGAA